MTVSISVHESRVAQVRSRPDAVPVSPIEDEPAPETGRGERDRIEIRCRRCGYGGVVVELPARCPMCGVCAWVVTGHANPALAGPGDVG